MPDRITAKIPVTTTLRGTYPSDDGPAQLETDLRDSNAADTENAVFLISGCPNVALTANVEAALAGQTVWTLHSVSEAKDQTLGHMHSTGDHTAQIRNTGTLLGHYLVRARTQIHNSDESVIDWHVHFILVQLTHLPAVTTDTARYDINGDDIQVGANMKYQIKFQVRGAGDLQGRLGEIHAGLIQNWINTDNRLRAHYQRVRTGSAESSGVERRTMKEYRPPTSEPFLDCEWDVRTPPDDAEREPFVGRPVTGEGELRETKIDDSPGAGFPFFISEPGLEPLDVDEDATGQANRWELRGVVGCNEFQVGLMARTRDAPWTFVISSRHGWKMEVDLRLGPFLAGPGFEANYGSNELEEGGSYIRTVPTTMGLIGLPSEARSAGFECFGPEATGDDEDEDHPLASMEWLNGWS